MPQLLNLPNELFLEVIRLVTPEGIEQLSWCSKDVYNVAKDALDYHRLRKQSYSIVSVHCAPFQVYQGELSNILHPLRFLADIAMDEDIAYYTTELILGGCHSEHEVFRQDEDREELNLSDKSKQWISDKVESCPYLDGYEIEDWIIQILSGFPGETSALLLTLLPNLHSVTIIDSFGSETPLGIIVSRMAQACSQNDQSYRPALGKTSAVSMIYGKPLDLYAPFAVLPSLRSFHGRMFGEEGFTWSFPPHISGVTDVRFSSCLIDAKSFTELFKGIKALASFVYEGGGLNSDVDNEWDPRPTLNDLLLHAKGSL